MTAKFTRREAIGLGAAGIAGFEIAGLAPMAASAADPSRARTCAPACEARTSLAATIPCRVMTIERACVLSRRSSALRAGPELADAIAIPNTRSRNFQRMVAVDCTPELRQ